MNTLKIDQSNLVQAYKAADKEGKKLLQNLFPTQLFDWKNIDSFEQVCKIEGVDPETYKMPDNATDEQRGIIAFSKLQLIYKVFNQGWKPDWSKSSHYKYYPWFRFIAGSGFAFDGYVFGGAHTYVGARLCTDTAEKAEYIGKTFISIYNEFLTIQ